MHHKILKHLLSLFFVLMLLSVLGAQQQENTTGKTPAQEKGELKNEVPQQEEQYRAGRKKQLEIKIY